MGPRPVSKWKRPAIRWGADPVVGDELAVVTGGSRGIGYAVARELAASGYRVVLTSRDQAAADHAAAAIAAEVGRRGSVGGASLELSSFDSIAAFASEISHEHRLAVLVNNAGVSPRAYATTETGFESHFGVNYIGHFLLTEKLLPEIQASGGAVFSIGSLSNVLATKKRLSRNLVDVATVQRHYHPVLQYATSKSALHLYMRHLVDRGNAGAKWRRAWSVYPGFVDTAIYDDYGFGAKAVAKALGVPAERTGNVVVNQLKRRTTPTKFYVGAQFPLIESLVTRSDQFAEAFYLKTCECLSVAPYSGGRRL